MSQKHFAYGIVGILILSLVIGRTGIERVFSLNPGSTVSSLQTIPTRTPVPAPTDPPAPNPTKPNGGGPATAVPTSTTQPLPTATATPITTIAYTPVGGFVPTAQSCGVPPTLTAQNPTNVRRGPGINYPVAGQLVYLEVRFILGRAADSAWWLIQLDDGDTGWVANDVVTVQGYIGGVPIVPAPAVNGQSPTPGTPWNPTPLPFCTVTPTATTTSSATPSPTTLVSEASSAAAGLQSTTESSEPTATPLPQPTQTAVAPPTLPPTTATTQSPTINAEQAAVSPVERAESGSATDWLLPIAGLLLIAGGAVAFVNRRKSS